ncbi:MAG TPA: FAD-dependent monooxygenase [Methylomirabilota bacterium]|nr:FAD-dependent monooxygenase [Methylomirabilota bacterium]
MSSVRTGVCIVGGGPAGLLLALLLARRGAQVLVLEGHESFDREFRGEVLQPSTAHLLDELGLLGYILAQPHSTLTSGIIRINGRPAGKFSFATIAPAYPYAIWMPQPIFLEALTRKAQPFSGFSCWMGARVTGLLEEGGTVVGVTGLRHGTQPFEVRADVVVGADGRHSVVRRLGGFAIEYERHDFDVIWFVIEQPPGWPSTLYFSLGREIQGLLLPKYPRHIQAGILLPRDEWRRWRQQGIAAVAARVRRLDPVFAPFAESLRDFTPFFPLEAIIRLVRDWARDGLLLIGDAAHTMSPAGAIGVNVALATAAVAAQEIYPLLGRDPIAHEQLARVQQLREPDVRTLHRLQRGAQRFLLARSRGGAVLRWLMPHLLPLLLRSPLLPRVQRRLLFGAPLPPLDPEFRFEP